MHTQRTAIQEISIVRMMVILESSLSICAETGAVRGYAGIKNHSLRCRVNTKKTRNDEHDSMLRITIYCMRPNA